MSLDVDLRISTGPNTQHTVYSCNIPHTVSPMWRAAGCLEELYESQGAAVAAVLPAFKAGLKHMLDYRHVHERLNPANGWGSYEDAVYWLRGLIEACETHPFCTVWSSP